MNEVPEKNGRVEIDRIEPTAQSIGNGVQQSNHGPITQIGHVCAKGSNVSEEEWDVTQIADITIIDYRTIVIEHKGIIEMVGIGDAYQHQDQDCKADQGVLPRKEGVVLH